MRIPWWHLSEWWPWRRWHIVARVDNADEIPDRLPPRGAVLVGDRRHPKWLGFDCPCGRRHRILLNLDTGRWPYWQLNHEQHITISPSVDASDPSGRCHYFITEGRVIWA